MLSVTCSTPVHMLSVYRSPPLCMLSVTCITPLHICEETKVSEGKSWHNIERLPAVAYFPTAHELIKHQKVLCEHALASRGNSSLGVDDLLLGAAHDFCCAAHSKSCLS